MLKIQSVIKALFERCHALVIEFKIIRNQDALDPYFFLCGQFPFQQLNKIAFCINPVMKVETVANTTMKSDSPLTQ